MAHQYDPDPFEEHAVDVNPFSVRPTAPPGAPTDDPFSKKDLKQKEKEIENKEAELRRREREVRRKEEELAKAGIFVEPKNWPAFCPIIHHDVMNDIPVHLQKMQYIAFASFLGMVVCFGWNIIAVLVAIIRASYGVNILLLAILYFIMAVPGGYVMWYRPLYRAFRTDSGLKYGVFFILYLLHLAMFFYATVAPPIIFSGRSLTGIFSAMIVLRRDSLAGIFYLIGFGFFLIETLLSIWVLQQVYRYFRGSASDAARREAAIRL